MRAVGMLSSIHASELSTCIPLHVVVGKSSNEVFRKDMRKFIKFAERMRMVGLIYREDKDRPTLKLFNVVYPMYISAEKNTVVYMELTK